MKDISNKGDSRWSATAITFDLPEVIQKAFDSKEITSPEGHNIQKTIIPGTMAVKKTSGLIPFCHPAALEKSVIIICEKADRSGLRTHCEGGTIRKTRIEIKTLTDTTPAAKPANRSWPFFMD